MTRNLLDVQIVRLLATQPMWGYMVKKQVEARFNVKLRHGALYPMLNSLEKQGFLAGQQERQGGRRRKVYAITRRGEEYIELYNTILGEQLDSKDIE